MFIDVSALTAILTDESDARELLARMQRSSRRITSPLVIWETTVAVARRLRLDLPRAAEVVEQFLGLTAVEITDVPANARFIALDAFIRFGKGRHPAALNFGDCFAYACARQAQAPLLYKGDDFARTNIEPA